MKYLAVLGVLILFSGCANDADDREFFNTGWVHPHKDAGDNSMFH